MSRHVSAQTASQKVIALLWPGERINRIQHLGLFSFWILTFFVVLFSLASIKSNIISDILLVVGFLFFVIQALYLKIQRLHDLDLSGWLIFLFLIPLFNLLFAIYLFVMPGTKLDNRYGPKPKPAGKFYYLMLLLFIIVVIAIPLIDYFTSK